MASVIRAKDECDRFGSRTFDALVDSSFNVATRKLLQRYVDGLYSVKYYFFGAGASGSDASHQAIIAAKSPPPRSNRLALRDITSEISGRGRPGHDSSDTGRSIS